MPHSACPKGNPSRFFVVMHPQHFSARRRSRRYIVLTVLVVLLIGGWIVFWKYAQAAAQDNIAGWKAREAAAGRVYDCGTQSIGGFPFRFEVLCDRASAVIRSANPPIELTAPNVHIAAQVYQPTLLISEIAGPLSFGEPGHAPSYTANWKLAQSSLRGTPREPERISIVIDGANVRKIDSRAPLVEAQRLEIHARMLEGSAASHPVLEFVLRSAKLSVPPAGALVVKPIDADIDAVLRGLNDFAPKPWPQRFRELAQSGGRVEIRSARVQQGDTLAVGSGALTINAQGRLDGQINMTVAGLEEFINDVAAANRQKLGFSVSLGLGLLGGNKKLEGRPAVTMPLRVTDGTIYLGPLKLGDVPALF
jgi:hypothetical protein